MSVKLLTEQCLELLSLFKWGCTGWSEATLVKIPHCWKSCVTAHILTHTSNAKSFRNVTLINIRGLAEIIVPVRGYGRHSPNQVMIKRE